MEYIIYCDESVSNGKFFSDFYGGALVSSTHFNTINDKLNTTKRRLNLQGEIKWTKVTEAYLDKYKEIISSFFEYIENEQIKIRIMFRQNAQVPANLTKEQKDNGFELLYYQFIKHAFGLKYAGRENDTYLRLYFDRLPLNKLKNEDFLNNIFALQSLNTFRKAKLKIRREDITEVNSHDHVILQCMDIILGAMAFRLNDRHKEKPVGSYRRGSRTIAKEKLYKHINMHINMHIRRLYPGFNVGSTTSKYPSERIWTMSYRHWKFTPREFIIDESKYK